MNNGELSPPGPTISMGGGAPFVVEVKSYVTHDGKQLSEHVVIRGALPANFVRFYGMGEIAIPAGRIGPVGVESTFQFPFPSNVTELDDALSLFESVATVYAKGTIVPQLKKEMQEKVRQAGGGIQIAGPDQMPGLIT